MDKQIKKLWVKALRSENYQQGQGKLCDTKKDTYCCLGVLACELGLMEEDGRIHPRGSYVYGYRATVPNSILREVGLSDDDCGHLMHLNDISGRPFSEIADHIEKNL